MHFEKITRVLIAFLALSLAACNSEKTSTGGEEPMVEAEPGDAPNQIDEFAEFKFSYTIANLPPPMEVLQEIVSSGMKPNTDALNPVGNASKSNSSFQQAINYGIYGVDLAYAGFYEQAGPMLKYYPVVRELASKLDLSESFNEFTSRYENFSSNTDSLKQILDEMYTKTDAYLRDNERLETASEILAGSWLEAQYITVSTLIGTKRNKKTEMIYQRVWEQRLYLDNITKLLETMSDNAEIANVKNGFAGLLEIYKEPKSTEEVDQAFLKRLEAELAKVRKSITT